MKKFIEEINLIQKIHSKLGLLGSTVAICYLFFANGSWPISQLNKK
ncbi:MAG: hypothetical protein RMY36_003250 [Nostoc sp. SerVER01]